MEEGDWCANNDPFSGLLEFVGLEERLIDGVEWQKTSLFKAYAWVIRRYGRAYNSDNEAELLRKCLKYEWLCENIVQRGYLTQRQLGLFKPDKEIAINIGMHGEFLFNGGGRHRLSIAKLAKLKAVPVIVKVRHARWQNIRDEVRVRDAGHYALRLEGGSDVDLGHPDLADIR